MPHPKNGKRARLAVLKFLAELGQPHPVAAVALLSLLIFGVTLGPLVAQKISPQQSFSRSLDGRKREPADLVRRRAAWFFRQRASTHGHIPAWLRVRALAQNKKMAQPDWAFVDGIAVPEAVISPNPNNWTPLGPQPTANTIFYGNVSGRVTAIVPDPCDVSGNTVYAGGADGGVWVSFNALSGNSATWSPLTDNQPSLSTGSLALDSSSCQMVNGHSQSHSIIIGTGESNYAADNLYGAGVLRSHDGGQSWQQDSTFTPSASLGQGASGPFIGALAVQPLPAGHENPVLLAAVQGTDFSAGGSLPSGIWRSTNGGNDWVRVQPDGGGVAGAPFNPGTDVVFDSSDPSGDTVYAALGDPKGDAHPQASCSAAPCNGVYLSTDAGMTWNRVAGLDSTSNPAAYGRISLAITPGASPSSSTLFVAIADASNLQNPSGPLLGVFKGSGIAANGTGGAWTNISNTSNLPDFCVPQCFYDMAIAVAPASSGSVVFVGGSAQPQIVGKSSIFRSIDGGNTWGDVSDDGTGNGTTTHVDVHAFGFASGTSGQALAMFVGNDGGVWSSEDVFNPSTNPGAQHWADLNTSAGDANGSLNLSQFYPGVSIHPASDQVLYGGTQGNDVQQFSGSLAWSDTLACPYDGGYTAIDQQLPSTIYAACSYLQGPGTLNKNVLNGVPGDDGVNWAAIDENNGINFGDNADFIPPFVIDLKNDQNLYFGTYRIYQTTNAGSTWAAITGDLTTDNVENFVTTIAMAPSDSNTFYTGTSDGLIWQSSHALSGATDIHKVNDASLQPARSVAAITVDTSNPKAAFVAYSGFSCPGVAGCDGLGHIFFTNNSGASWMRVDGNLPDIPVNDIVIDPADPSDNTVYAATDSGVYASTNATAGAATSWSVLQSGLPNSEVLSLKLRNTSRTLIAATHGRGVWSLLLPNLPAFVLTELNPVGITAGSGSVSLTTTGAGFTRHSVINFNGSALTTTFLDATTLSATIPSSLVACGGPASVNVTDPAAGTTNALTFSVVGAACDFSFGAANPLSETIAPGGTANYSIPVLPVGSAGAPVTLACISGLPAGAVCTFTPNPVTPATGGTNVALAVTVPASANVPASPSAWRLPPSLRGAPIVLLAFAISSLFFVAMKLSRERRTRIGFACAVAILILAGMSACGGGGGGGPHAQTFQVGIQGTSGTFQHSTTVQLVVN